MTKITNNCPNCPKTYKNLNNLITHRIGVHTSKISREYLEGFGDTKLIAQYDRAITIQRG